MRAFFLLLAACASLHLAPALAQDTVAFSNETCKTCHVPYEEHKVNAYLEMSRRAGKVWKEHGALEYRECVGDDLNIKKMTGFPKVVKSKAGETVVFSWIVYKSRAHRDAVNKKVMKDERIAAMMDPKGMPFDVKRMAMGGFKVAVDL